MTPEALRHPITPELLALPMNEGETNSGSHSSLPKVLKLDVQTQTTETFSLAQAVLPEAERQSMPEEEAPAPLAMLKDVHRKQKSGAKPELSGSRGFSNFRSDDEDGYRIGNQMKKFKFQMIQRKNSVAESKRKTEEEELDEYIRFFEKAIDENNYEIIENMEMLYSCTANYVSYFFSFEQFEKQHHRNLKNSLFQNKLTFPDLFTRFID